MAGSAALSSMRSTSRSKSASSRSWRSDSEASDRGMPGRWRTRTSTSEIGPEVGVDGRSEDGDAAQAVGSSHFGDGATGRMSEGLVKGPQRGRARVGMPTRIGENTIEAAGAHGHGSRAIRQGHITVQQPVGYLIARQAGDGRTRRASDCPVDSDAVGGRGSSAQHDHPPQGVVAGECYARVRPECDEQVAIRWDGRGGNVQQTVQIARRHRDRVVDAAPGLARSFEEAGQGQNPERFLRDRRR